MMLTYTIIFYFTYTHRSWNRVFQKNEVHKFVVHNFVYQYKFCAFSLNYLILCTWGLERCVAFL